MVLRREPSPTTADHDCKQQVCNANTERSCVCRAPRSDPRPEGRARRAIRSPGMRACSRFVRCVHRVANGARRRRGERQRTSTAKPLTTEPLKPKRVIRFCIPFKLRVSRDHQGTCDGRKYRPLPANVAFSSNSYAACTAMDAFTRMGAIFGCALGG